MSVNMGSYQGTFPRIYEHKLALVTGSARSKSDIGSLDILYSLCTRYWSCNCPKFGQQRLQCDHQLCNRGIRRIRSNTRRQSRMQILSARIAHPSRHYLTGGMRTNRVNCKGTFHRLANRILSNRHHRSQRRGAIHRPTGVSQRIRVPPDL